MSSVGLNLFIPPQVDDIYSSAEVVVFENNFGISSFDSVFAMWDINVKIFFFKIFTGYFRKMLLIRGGHIVISVIG